MTEPRVSAERLAEIETEPCGKTVRLLVADLRDSRAREAALEQRIAALERQNGQMRRALRQALDFLGGDAANPGIGDVVRRALK